MTVHHWPGTCLFGNAFTTIYKTNVWYSDLRLPNVPISSLPSYFGRIFRRRIQITMYFQVCFQGFQIFKLHYSGDGRWMDVLLPFLKFLYV